VPQPKALRRVGEQVMAISRGDTHVHLDLRRRLASIFAVTVVVDLIGSVLVLMFEKNVGGSKIETFGDSVFWTTTQLLTVSSQLPNPISTGGRITDVFLQAYAISVVATLAGSFSAFFHIRSVQRHPIQQLPAEQER
jgi:hypothetical protein